MFIILSWKQKTTLNLVVKINNVIHEFISNVNKDF